MYLSPPSALLFYQPVGPNAIATESGTLDFHGDITGGGTVTVTALIRPSAGETFVAYWSAPATVDGTPGTLTFAFTGKDNGTYSGHFVVKGSGGLAGLTGEGTFSGQDASGLGTYSFRWVG